MCLTTKSLPKRNTKSKLLDIFLKTATRNITVYKQLKLTKYYLYPYEKQYKSPYQYTIYSPDILYKSRLGITWRWDGKGLVVSEGRHAYNNIKKAREMTYGISSYKIAKMTIPKGSKYIVGVDGDIVSNRLIWKKSIIIPKRGKK